MNDTNCSCKICNKPLHRKPNELKKYLHFFCSRKCYGLFSTKKRLTKMCEYCKKEFYFYRDTQRYCSMSCANSDKNRGGGYPKGRPNNLKGKTFDEIYGKEKSLEIRKKISLKWKNNNPPKGTEKYAEKCKKHSIQIKKRYEQGWLPKAGRCKKIEYNSQIAGIITVDGTWELLVAKFLDTTGLQWDRNTRRFPYYFENVERNYTPDFYVKDFDVYIEVKGYKTLKDTAKWEQFKNKLLILQKNEIELIKQNKYNIIWDNIREV